MTNTPSSSASGGRKFPDIAQYRTAVQGLHFHDAELLTCTPKMGKMKRPLHYSGAFAVAFPFLNAAGTTRYAVRFWTQRVPGNTVQRYAALADSLRESAELSAHFATFHYVSDGVKVLMSGNMETYPLLRMDWVGGESPKEFILRAMSPEVDPATRRALLSQAIAAWRKMLTTLQLHGVAHGDLWNDNIRFVTDTATGQVRCVLLDYDSIFVPQLVHPPRVTGSVSGYRNPFDATSEKLDTLDEQESARCDDYFSGFALLVSFEGLADNAQLWQEFGGIEPGENAFLFREADFVAPDRSALFARLRDAESTSLKRCSHLLYEICRNKLPSRKLLPLNEMLQWDAAERLGLSIAATAPGAQRRDIPKTEAVPVPGSSFSSAPGSDSAPVSGSGSGSARTGSGSASASGPGSGSAYRQPPKETDWRAALQAHLHSIGLTGLTIQARGEGRWSVCGTVQDAAQRRLALQKCQETDSPFTDEILLSPNAYTRLEEQMHSVGLRQLSVKHTSTGWEVHGTVPTQEQYNMARHLCDNSQLPLMSRFLFVPPKAKAGFPWLVVASVIILLMILTACVAAAVLLPGYIPIASLLTPAPPVKYVTTSYTHLKVGTPLEIKPEAVKQGDRFTASNLPSDLKLDPATGVISGALAAGGEYNVVVSIIRDGVATTHAIHLQIDALERVTYPLFEFNNPKIGSKVNLPTNVASGDVFTLSGFPPGIKIDPVSGVISGEILVSGKGIGVVSITRKGDDHKIELPYVIDQPQFPVFAKRYEFKQNQPAGPVYPELPANSPYPLDAYKFEMSKDQSLPVGLTLDEHGKIMGRPTQAGTTTYVVTVSLGQEKKAVQMTIDVAAEPVVVVERPPDNPKPVDPPPPPPPPVTPQTPLDQAKADPAFLSFLKSWGAAQFSDRAADWANSFAPVAYFGSKNVMTTVRRADIEADRQKLISKTFNRKYEFTNMEVTSYSPTTINCILTMKYNYNNGVKRGTSTMTLKLEKTGNEWLIVHFFEKVDIEAR